MSSQDSDNVGLGSANLVLNIAGTLSLQTVCVMCPPIVRTPQVARCHVMPHHKKVETTDDCTPRKHEIITNLNFLPCETFEGNKSHNIVSKVNAVLRENALVGATFPGACSILRSVFTLAELDAVWPRTSEIRPCKGSGRTFRFINSISKRT